MDLLIKRKIAANPGDFLAVKGYPASHTVISPPNILRKPSFHLGSYGGPTDDKHCHFFDAISPPIGDPDGLSGAPVVMMDPVPSCGIVPTLLGVVTRGGVNTQFLRFVGVDVVIRLVSRIDKEFS